MAETLTPSYFHDALTERRSHLLRARDNRPDDDILDLIVRVDQAIERLERGEYGICTVCHGAIETDRLVRDPLAASCAEHPGAAEEARLRRDLALAHELQLRMLPRPDLTIAGWTYGYRYEAAGEVGGDFCDVIPRPARAETLVIVGDVAGHGVAASMLMTHLLATFRSLAALDLTASELLTRVNDLFHDSVSSASYATLAAAALHRDGTVDLYSAGHWTPLLRRGDTVVPAPLTPGLPLGLFPGSRYSPARLQPAADDALLFFTDGAIDAENGNGEDYSLRRLGQALGAADGAPLDALLDRCLQDVRQFQNGQPAGDDLLLLALRRSTVS